MIEFLSQNRRPDFSHIFLKIFIQKSYSKYIPRESLFRGIYNAILIDIVRPQISSEICCKDKACKRPLQQLGGRRVLSVKAAQRFSGRKGLINGDIQLAIEFHTCFFSSSLFFLTEVNWTSLTFFTIIFTHS